MNLKHLSNHELHQQTKHKADGERLATIELLWHLREIERRMLYAQMSYRDLKEYCVKELKLSEGSAWRRINAMRLLKEVPEVECKIQSGELSLTQVTMARAHFREVKVTQQEKKNILAALENQSARATERILVESRPAVYAPVYAEKEKALRGQKLEVTFVLDEETQKNLEEIEVLLGKKYSKLELFKMMTKKTLDQLRVKSLPKSPAKITAQKKVSANKSDSIRELGLSESSSRQVLECKAQPALKSPGEKSRYIPAEVRRFVSARDQRRCQYVDPVSKRQCESRAHLQQEHIQAFAKGGSNTPSNLQLLCSAHNKLRAVQAFGINKMKMYQPSLR